MIHAPAARAVGLSCAGVALVLATLLPPARSFAWTQDRFLVGGFGVGSVTDTSRLVRLADAGLDVVLNSDQWANWSARQFVGELATLRAHHAGFALRGIVSAKADPGHERGDWRTVLPDCGGTARRSRADDLSDNVNPDLRGVRSGIRAALRPEAGLVSPAVLGWFLHDEPALPVALDRAFWADTVVAAAAPGGLPYVTLMPPYVAEDAAPCVGESYRARFGDRKRDAYPAYLDAWLCRFDSLPGPAPVLSADHYPFERAGRERPDFLFALRELRAAAARHGRGGQAIPLWLVLQLSPLIGAQGTSPTPTPEQSAYTAWAALAHGAKAVLWWTLVPLPPYGPGLLDDAGAPTPRYAVVRALDARLHRVGNVLFACDPVATFLADSLGQEGVADECPGTPGAKPGIVRAFDRDASGRPPRTLLAGHLRTHGGGNDFLLVVNRDAGAEAAGRLVLDGPHGRIDRLDLASGTWVPVASGAAAFDVTPALPAGGAALYRLSAPAR